MARRGWRTFRVAAGAILLLLTPAAPAFAQGSKAASQADPTKNATQLLYNEGVAFAKKGEWEKAYQAFQSAWKLREHWQIAANLGRAELMTGRHVAAAEHLSFFLREAKDISGPDRAAVQKLLNEAKQRIATLIVKVNRPGAEVLLDGQVVGQAPLSRELYMDPGSHTLEARLGAETAERVTVDLTAGQSRQVGLTFFSRGTGTVRKTAPEQPQQVKPQKTEETEDEDSPSGASTGVLVTGGVITGAALVSGAVFIGLASSLKNEEFDGCYGDSPTKSGSECNNATEQANRERATEFTNVAVWSFIGAGVVGATTLIYGLTAKGSPQATMGTRVVPVGTANGGGVMVLGRW